MNLNDCLKQGHSDYELLTTTRFDPFLLSLKWNDDREGPTPLLLLPYHLDRLLDAGEQHGWEAVKGTLNYDVLKSACQDALAVAHEQGSSSAFRIRICLSKAGALTASASPAPPLVIDPTVAAFFNPETDNTSLFAPVLTIHVDKQAILPSIFSTTKTTDRTIYDEARSRNRVPALSTPAGRTSDVLIYNTEGHVMETTIFNVAFFRSSRWITPSISTGCLSGVLRRWLLEEGRIEEDTKGILTKDSIKTEDWVLLFNGAQGCRVGRITS